MPRNNILLTKVPQTKLVRLPNGRSFYAKYARVGRRELPQNVQVAQTYVRKIGPTRQRRRRGQTGRGINQGIIMTGLNLPIRGAETDLGKMIIKDATDFVPTAYTSLKNRLLKKNLRQ